MSESQRRQRRIAFLFARDGEPFTLTRSGVSRLLNGLFAPMDPGTAAAYFDADESVGLVRPALALYVEGALADPPVASDVFTRDGRLWTVRKTFFFRWGDAPLVILALCD